MNFRQISRVSLSPDIVDGIVFWTKNPMPMLERLDELENYMYYFQFTITPYGKDIETNLPAKDELVQAFKRLSSRIGADRMLWRYDPILINEKYTMGYHTRAFGKMAESLQGYTKKATISFVETNYKGVQNNTKELALLDFHNEMKTELALMLAEIAKTNGIVIESCATSLELLEYDIEPSKCIDDRLFSKLLGCELVAGKDKNQRPVCGCAVSIDIGMYNTCKNGCRYCYANYIPKVVSDNFDRHSPRSAIISGVVAMVIG